MRPVQCGSPSSAATFAQRAGGVGTAKASANYAASLRASTAAAARGCGVALWLDAHEQRYIQELSGMNLFAVIRGELHTPELDGAILPGITRDSLLALGRHLGFKIQERRMAIDELLGQISAGECSELFACGTAAIVSPIACIGRSERPRVCADAHRCHCQRTARGSARGSRTPRTGPLRLDTRRLATRRGATRLDIKTCSGRLRWG